MVDRHTHVFGSERADTASDVTVNWEKIKKKEKGMKRHYRCLKGGSRKSSCSYEKL